MEHLLLVSLGPVQATIVHARRTRDLWFGSWLLSDLARALALTLDTIDPAAQLIIPTKQAIHSASDEHAAIPNQLFMLVTVAPAAIIPQLQQSLERRLIDHVRATPVFSRLEQAEAQLARQQVASMVTLQWAALPADPAVPYPEQRRQLYHLMTARKHSRTFAPIPWDQPAGRVKSSLDGQREALRLLPDSKDRRTRPGEHLSGVDLLKRYAFAGEERAGFPSTSHMAAVPLRQRLNDRAETNPGIIQAWQTYIATLNTLDPALTADEQVGRAFRTQPLFDKYDGSLVFESRLGDELPHDGSEKAKQQIAALRLQARTALHTFLKATDSPNEPPAYYALLAADGDHMGRALDTIGTLAGHQDFSNLLAQFARNAATIVTQHQGAAVYTGGDDVLALLPVHQAVACARTLNQEFRQAMQAMPQLAEHGALPTLSVGIVIVHHLDALQDALELVRAAEQHAKVLRNALTIVLSKRNGADRWVRGAWHALDDAALDQVEPASALDQALARGERPFVASLERLTALHRRQILSDSFIFALQDVVQRLQPIGAPTAIQEQAHWRAILALELGRIIRRARTEAGAAFDPATLLQLEQIAGFADTPQAADDPFQQLTAFISLNIVARELARVEQIIHPEEVSA